MSTGLRALRRNGEAKSPPQPEVVRAVPVDGWIERSGLRASLSLIRREFTSYFLLPVGYVAIVLFLLGMGVLFRFTFGLLTAEGAKGIEFPMQGLLGNVGFWLIYWVIPPLLTMRLFAEERSTNTLESLLTAPLRDSQVVLCKFIACFAFYIVLWLPTLCYLPVLLDLQFTWPGWTVGRMLATAGFAVLPGLLLVVFTTNWLRTVGVILAIVSFLCWIVGWLGLRWKGESYIWINPGIDPMPAWTTYIGILTAGAMFLSMGLWVSSLVRSQIVAALISLAINLVFILGGLLILGGFYQPPSDAGALDYRLVQFFSVPLHFSQDFTRGVIDSRYLVLYGSVTLAMLFLTVRSLERRRMQ